MLIAHTKDKERVYARDLGPSRERFICPECFMDVTRVDDYETKGWPVGAHFRHVPGVGAEDIPHKWAKESYVHHAGKEAMRDALMAIGLNAELEVIHYDPANHKHVLRKGDVVVDGPGRPFVIEIQYSTITPAEIYARTKDWNDAGYAVMWVPAGGHNVQTAAALVSRSSWRGLLHRMYGGNLVCYLHGWGFERVLRKSANINYPVDFATDSLCFKRLDAGGPLLALSIPPVRPQGKRGAYPWLADPALAQDLWQGTIRNALKSATRLDTDYPEAEHRDVVVARFTRSIADNTAPGRLLLSALDRAGDLSGAMDALHMQQNHTFQRHVEARQRAEEERRRMEAEIIRHREEERKARAAADKAQAEAARRKREESEKAAAKKLAEVRAYKLGVQEATGNAQEKVKQVVAEIAKAQKQIREKVGSVKVTLESGSRRKRSLVDFDRKLRSGRCVRGGKMIGGLARGDLHEWVVSDLNGLRSGAEGIAPAVRDARLRNGYMGDEEITDMDALYELLLDHVRYKAEDEAKRRRQSPYPETGKSLHEELLERLEEIPELTRLWVAKLKFLQKAHEIEDEAVSLGSQALRKIVAELPPGVGTEDLNIPSMYRV